MVIVNSSGPMPMSEMTEDGRLQLLVQTIAPQSSLLRAWPLKGGISAGMIAFEIVHADGQTSRMVLRQPGRQALRQNPHAASDEFKLLQQTRLAGLATPAPRYLDESGTIFATPYLVLDYIEGQPEFAPADKAAYAGQLATQLAGIHSLDSARHDLAFLPRWTAGSALPPGAPAPHSALDEGCIRAALAPVWPLPQRNTPVLLHGDFWPGNVLWRAGGVVGVIDWEDASRGDPLSDLAISRLELAWIFGLQTMHVFSQQYRSIIALDDSDLPYWDLYAALRMARLAGAQLAAWAASYAAAGRPDITARSLGEQYQLFVEQALEQL